MPGSTSDGLDLWKELEVMHQTGRLSEPHSRLYFGKQRPMFELYDLKQDPEELNDLIAQEENLEIEKELKAKLQESMILQQDYLPMPTPDFNPFLKR